MCWSMLLQSFLAAVRFYFGLQSMQMNPPEFEGVQLSPEQQGLDIPEAVLKQDPPLVTQEAAVVDTVYSAPNNPSQSPRIINSKLFIAGSQALFKDLPAMVVVGWLIALHNPLAISVQHSAGASPHALSKHSMDTDGLS